MRGTAGSPLTSSISINTLLRLGHSLSNSFKKGKGKGPKPVAKRGDAGEGCQDAIISRDIPR